MTKYRYAVWYAVYYRSSRIYCSDIQQVNMGARSGKALSVGQAIGHNVNIIISLRKFPCIGGKTR